MKLECDTKTKLLRVAIELIAESSYGSVSVDDICKKAEVKKGSFYHFFPSKADLTVAAMEADWQAGQPRLDRIFSSQTPPVERLTAYFESSCEKQASAQEKFGKICGCPMITLGAELSTQDEKIRQKTVEIVNRYLKYFESAVRDAVEEGVIAADQPRALAEELFAYFQGSMLQAKIRNDLKPLLAAKKGLARWIERPVIA